MVPRVLRALNQSRTLKRAIDVTVAGTALTVGAPLIGALTGAVLVKHGWPPFFVQRRPGKDGRVFPLVKFRTMTDERDAEGNLLPDEERLTPLGRWMRATSVDELPELLNVLAGQMSLVGPRPLLVRYLDRYTPEQRRRHDVPPGVTGRAQVHGRNALSWEEKFSHDLEYVEGWSNLEDLRLLLKTVLVVLRREGIAHEGSETMPEFMGSEPGEGDAHAFAKSHG